ncbi:MAG: AAA domain-containing protein [Nitrospira sp.]|nr:AAA domain-containing protein [Nitrospira sp.]MDH4244527.1 AAA domain-containing protein [Nitrospira sp.]MDH4357357.1 AAA domain-containing protein [Nitrospira sp.]MDH5319634.1 AAA domain-containing protein [Nitrospira sp.]
MNGIETSKALEMTPERDKAVRLFTYLRDLCALRTTQVRNVKSFDQVFWLNDLPHHKLCRSRIWCLTDSAASTPDQNADVWIEIRKPAIKSPPELPDELEPWIKDEELADSSLNEPGFYEQIPLSAILGESENIDPKVLASINDYPHVLDKWVHYVDEWKCWAAADRELQKVQKAYNQLFNIYQRQEKLGEQYEVVVGTGLLLWSSSKSGEIKRHILTFQARIEFDRVRGIMSVGPAIDGPQPMLECSMLETSDRPNPTDLTAIEDDAIALDGDPWTAIGLERALRGFANALPITGDYTLSLEHSGEAFQKPIVKLAPALILRKRTRRTFEDFYGQIIDQIEKGEEIPENIRRIIEVIDDHPLVGGEEREAGTGDNTVTQTDVELYFPLPANDEQRAIVQKVERRRGVLVQGPPGTGKSHTIANLVSHFLANGKRVLVTSETPRALEVLREKLPREIEELCVVWLGSGPDSQEALEKSVKGITRRKANWNDSRELGLIDQHTRRLDAERKDQARLRHDLRACREVDVYQHATIQGRYSGTLQQIAMIINEERDRFQWFMDRPQDVAVPTVTGDDLSKMAQIRRELNPKLVEEIRLKLFPLEQLIQPGEFRVLVDAERNADLAHKEAQSKHGYPGYAHLPVLPREKRDAIKRTIEGILATQDTLSRHYHTWVQRACHEIAGDQDRVWRQIHTETLAYVGHIERQVYRHGALQVVGLDAKDLRLVEEEATALREHLELGKGLGFWFMRPQVVKDSRYLIETVTVNGKPCNTIQSLNQLIAWIAISLRAKALGAMWNGITSPPAGDVVLQCSAYRDFCEPIEQALALHDRIEEVRKICRDYPSIRLPAWHSQEEVHALSKALDAVSLEEDLARAQRVFKPLAGLLADLISSGHIHGSAEDLRKAVEERNSELYHQTYESLSSLHSWKDAHSFADDVHLRFHSCAPRTCESYDRTYSELVWDKRFAKFEDAWVWAKTDRWMDEKGGKEQVKQIQLALQNSTSRERDTLKNLAASKAWLHCMKRLGSAERTALMAWAAEAKEVRTGTGRYAERHRENARQYLDQCRSAIPCWVMPLYQLVQTVRPGRSIFDVVIIDEASQSGADAWLINYIADRTIVVGDPQQIAPMNVGLDLEQVEYLRRKHLKDIPFAPTLGPPHSLFDQAKVRYADEVRLREHFRCMPEIIQFCNDLSYTTEPLIPLRQYGADRLKPVQAVFVKEGYRKGGSEDIENPPEAEKIVAQIAECCENSAYTNKTFGVICLKGNRQAELINSLLVKEIGAVEMEKRRIVCGRPYDFQGDERDVVFISMVDALDDGHIRCDMNNLDVQRRYNVAASRARDQLWLFHSVSLNDLRPGSYQYRILQHCQEPRIHQPEHIGDTTISELRRMAGNSAARKGPSPDPFDSWFEIDVFLKIVNRGFRVLPQYHVNDRRIDLVVEGLRGRLAVECDGDEFHALEHWESDMTRQRELERHGWTFWRVRGYDFYRDPDGALAELWDTLERLKITPKQEWESERKQSEARSTTEEHSVEPGVTDKWTENLEDDTEADEAEEESEEELPSSEHAEGRFDRALEYARSSKRRPEELPPQDIQHAVIRSLQKCPNQSCTLKSLTGRVLKQLGVLTRGNPRLEFEKRVMRNLGALKRKGLIEEYKAKNRRIRLLGPAQLSIGR